MTIRTIVASSMQQAMQEAKREMGDDAIIVSSRRVDDHFEVTVTDDADCLSAAASKQADEIKAPEQVKAATRSPSADQTRPAAAQPQPAAIEPLLAANEPALKKLMSDLRSIGDHWQNMGGEGHQHTPPPVNPVHEELNRRLACLQLEEHIKQDLLQQFRDIPDIDRAWHLALAQLQARLTTSTIDVIADGGAYVFVGPSGAGKTASIAKLAAEYVLLHGAHNIALITTDAFRIGAGEQLLKLGEILGVDVIVVEPQSEGLAATLAVVASKRTVLIDSAGLGGDDAELAAQLADIRGQGERIKSVLVVPANIQYASMQAAYEGYRVQPYAGCVFTRLDECSSLGSAVSLALDTGLPLAYIATGHAIPEDLDQVDSTDLVEKLLSFASTESSVRSSTKSRRGRLPRTFAQQLRLAF